MKTLAPSNTAVTARDAKGFKFTSIVEAAYNKAGLSEEEAQRVNDTPGLADVITGFINENRYTDKYKNEEVKSGYGYLSGYKPTSLHDQTNLLRKLFPGISVASPSLLMQVEEKKIALPQNAEGWFVIPNWKKHPEIFGSTYSAAVQKVLDTLSETRKGRFYNYRDGAIDEQHLRQSARTEEFLAKLAEEQGNPDILIIPAQFGIRHRGRSVRRAREVMVNTTGEIGLGAFAVGCMLLTHPNRLQHYDDLWIDCAGDEFSPEADGVFSESPCFFFGGGKLWFGAGGVDGARDLYGSASAFSPQ